MSKRRKYTKEFKEEIVQLVTKQGKTQKEVSEDLSINPSTISKWVSEYSEDRENAFPGNGKLKPNDEEIRLMKKRMKDLEEENAILKKAISIFTQPQK